jgi:hypothetical protein
MAPTVDDIVELARSSSPDPDELQQRLDEASHAERVEAIRQFGRSTQRKLFELCEGRPVTIDRIVPPETDPMTEVIHEGQNTLPAFRAFQKRFCRPDPDEYDTDREVLWGYNEQTFKMFTGPGYFVAYDDEETGEVIVDYRRLPEAHPDGWPDIVPNKTRLGRFVYAGTVDRLRSISEHVTIGRAFIDDDDPLNAWFVLARQ